MFETLLTLRDDGRVVATRPVVACDIETMGVVVQTIATLSPGCTVEAIRMHVLDSSTLRRIMRHPPFCVCEKNEAEVSSVGSHMGDFIF